MLGELPTVTIGATFNQFRDGGPDDVPKAPAIRLANLRRYLEERREADVVAVGEAAGYQGMRWSGIAFTSEFDLLGWGDPYRRSSRRPRPWKEPSGTIVHGILEELGAERRVILWNTVPTHPHVEGRLLSNRRPTRDEVIAGHVFIERLVDLVHPRILIGVGRVFFGLNVFRNQVGIRHPYKRSRVFTHRALRVHGAPNAQGLRRPLAQ